MDERTNGQTDTTLLKIRTTPKYSLFLPPSLFPLSPSLSFSLFPLQIMIQPFSIFPLFFTFNSLQCLKQLLAYFCFSFPFLILFRTFLIFHRKLFTSNNYWSFNYCVSLSLSSVNFLLIFSILFAYYETPTSLLYSSDYFLCLNDILSFLLSHTHITYPSTKSVLSCIPFSLYISFFY